MLIIISLQAYNREQIKLNTSVDRIKIHPEPLVIPVYYLTFDSEEEAERYRAITRIVNQKKEKLSLPQVVNDISFEEIYMKPNSNMIVAKFRYISDYEQSTFIKKVDKDFAQMKSDLCSMLNELSPINQTALLKQKTFWRVQFYTRKNILFREQDIEINKC